MKPKLFGSFPVTLTFSPREIELLRIAVADQMDDMAEGDEEERALHAEFDPLYTKLKGINSTD